MSTIDIAIPQDRANTLVDPVAYADGRIHETYAWLRANNPMGMATIEGVDPFWVATKHADILEISRQNALFSNGEKSATMVSHAVDARVRAMTGGSPHLLRTLVQMDAPDHMKYRVLTQSWFLPQNIRSLETRIRTIAKAAVETMLSKGNECDFVNEVALHYPLRVIMEIMGVPPEDEPRMLMLTQELFGASDPELGSRQKQKLILPPRLTWASSLTSSITSMRSLNPSAPIPPMTWAP